MIQDKLRCYRKNILGDYRFSAVWSPSKDTPIIKTLANNIKRFGLNGAFAGVPLKIGMTIIGWGTVSAITQQSSTVPEEGKFSHKF